MSGLNIFQSTTSTAIPIFTSNYFDLSDITISTGTTIKNAILFKTPTSTCSLMSADYLLLKFVDFTITGINCDIDSEYNCIMEITTPTNSAQTEIIKGYIYIFIIYFLINNI